MKAKTILPFVVLTLLFTTYRGAAQVFKISTSSQSALVFGDITKTGVNNPSAGYVEYGSGVGFAFNFYFKNRLGLGLRSTGTLYTRDVEQYETDLKAVLGITDDQYDLTPAPGFLSFGSDFGVSYLIDLSDKWQFEPYFYLGLNILGLPESSAIYAQNGTTYQFNTKAQPYVGLSYSPGAKFNWNFSRQFGLYFSLEYNGRTYVEDNERSLSYSANSFVIADVPRAYSINSVNLGFGLSFSFGKGLPD